MTKNKLLPCTLAVLVTVGILQAGSVAGVAWEEPSSWKPQPRRPMRAATYAVPAAPGDSESGECAVYFFGTGQGGSVEANIRRWLGQFRTAEGNPVESAEREDRTINGLEVTTLDVSGTFMFKPAPFAPKTIPKPGYRMLAAIVQAPEGPVFFKLTAPEKTAAAAEEDFQQMLESLEKQ